MFDYALLVHELLLEKFHIRLEIDKNISHDSQIMGFDVWRGRDLGSQLY